jgi:hypothetical protein
MTLTFSCPNSDDEEILNVPENIAERYFGEMLIAKKSFREEWTDFELIDPDDIIVLKRIIKVNTTDIEKLQEQCYDIEKELLLFLDRYCIKGGSINKITNYNHLINSGIVDNFEYYMEILQMTGSSNYLLYRMGEYYINNYFNKMKFPMIENVPVFCSFLEYFCNHNNQTTITNLVYNISAKINKLFDIETGLKYYCSIPFYMIPIKILFEVIDIIRDRPYYSTVLQMIKSSHKYRNQTKEILPRNSFKIEKMDQSSGYIDFMPLTTYNIPEIVHIKILFNSNSVNLYINDDPHKYKFRFRIFAFNKTKGKETERKELGTFKYKQPKNNYFYIFKYNIDEIYNFVIIEVVELGPWKEKKTKKNN